MTSTCVDWHDLKHLPRPPGTADGKAAGRWWDPVPHHELISLLLEAGKADGTELEVREVHLSPDSLDLAVSFTAKDRQGMPPGWLPLLGATSSNARRKAFRVLSGTVSPDGAEVVLHEVLRHRHTIRTDRASLLAGAVAGFRERTRGLDRDIARLERKEITYPRQCEILAEAAKRGLITWTRIGRCESLLRGKGDTGSRSAWEVLLAFARVTKLSPPLLRMERVLKFKGTLPT